MLPPVVVDLGPDAGAAAVQVVLAACNRAIASGVCVPQGSGGAEQPRAVAVARPTDRRVLVVRIEVQLGLGSEAPLLVREIAFAPRDPLRERWRSVGLAIATLVGEGEQRQEERFAPEPAPEPVAPEQPSSEAELEAGPEVAAEPELEAAPADRETEPRDEPDLEPEERAAAEREGGASQGQAPVVWDFSHRPVFIGLGVLTGPGFGAGAWRVGGSLRAGWSDARGLQLAGALSYAVRASRETFSADWYTLRAGAGYRLQGERASAGVLLWGGAQRARFEVLAGGVSRSETRWNPLVGLGADARFRLTPWLGVWAALDATTLARESRLFISADREPVGAFFVDVAGIVGLAAWPW